MRSEHCDGCQELHLSVWPLLNSKSSRHPLHHGFADAQVICCRLQWNMKQPPQIVKSDRSNSRMASPFSPLPFGHLPTQKIFAMFPATFVCHRDERLEMGHYANRSCVSPVPTRTKLQHVLSTWNGVARHGELIICGYIQGLALV